MFTLLHGFYKYLVQKDEYCVLILGLDDAGKTVSQTHIWHHSNRHNSQLRSIFVSFSLQTYLEAAKTKLCKNYKGMNPKYITTTVGLNIGQIDIKGIRLSFWDLGGQQELQSLWDKYYQESHAIIYVIDSHDRERMDESKAVFGKYIDFQLLLAHILLLMHFMCFR